MLLKHIVTILLVGFITTPVFANTYPWGTRDTYMDNVPVDASTLKWCSFYYKQRTLGHIATAKASNGWSYYISGKLRAEEANSFIIVFCGFTRIHNGKPPHIFGKATFSTPKASRAWKAKNKK